MRKKENNLFFEFLQVSIRIRKSLSVAIGDSDWQGLFEFCKRQALIGVGFSAVEKLHTLGIVCPANLRMQWMALALQIEKKNGGTIKHGVWKLKRVMRLVSSYPEEALWEPWFRVWHLVWRGING